MHKGFSFCKVCLGKNPIVWHGQHPEGAGKSNALRRSRESSVPVESWSSSTADSLGFVIAHAVDTLNVGHTI